MGMAFTFSNLFQLISSMSSFLLVFFMVMISFFNSDAKGLIYLGFLMIASILNVLLMNSKKSEPCAERSQFCNVMEFPWNPHNYNSPDYNSMVIMFTAAYLLLPMIYNKQMNYGAIMFMLILFAFNYITQIMFFFLSALAVFSAIMVLVSRNPVHSVLWLIAVFFAISGHYILLNAQFLAIVNLIVYAGAIMVLFLFVIMLMNLNKESEPNKHIWMKLAGAISGGCFLMVMVSLVRQAADFQGKEALVGTGDIGLIKNLGKALFSNYVVPFEISSVLFLSAMVGAVVIGKKE